MNEGPLHTAMVQKGNDSDSPERIGVGSKEERGRFRGSREGVDFSDRSR